VSSDLTSVTRLPESASQRRLGLSRDLRAIVTDGIFFNVMVGVGETYLPAFVLALGHGDTAAGLIATLPILFGSILQLVTPYGARRVGSYRRWTVACAILQGASFVPLVGGALAGHLNVIWVFAASTLYWAAGLATGPTWNVWVGALVPARLRAPFFAHRARWLQLSLLLALTGAGWILHGTRGGGDETRLFALLFALAAGARFISCAALAATREIRGAAARQQVLAAPAATRYLRGTAGGRILAYLLATQGAAHIAAPYFTPYMLSDLGLSYGRFTLLTATAFASRMLVLPFIGRLSARWGVHRILLIGGIAIVPVPPLWLLSDAYIYLLFLQILAGAAWAALEFGTLMSFFEILDEEHRVSVLSVYNLANAAAVAVGSLLGAAVFRFAGVTPTGYAILFIASAAARALAVPLLLRAPRDLPGSESVVLRTLAVRPSAGAIQRVVLPTLETADRSGSDPRNPR
jgi:MFS family permease